jgi:hypothetical protein
MTRRTVIIAALATGLALLALLGYSLERTAWLFARFETQLELAYAAAVVVELAAVALIAGASAIAGLDLAARAWANRALLAVLSTQALANLAAGYLRGGQATLGLFGSTWPAYAVASTLWLVVNLSVPALVLCLSKLLERLIASPAMRRSRRDLRAQRRALVRRLVGVVRTARALLDSATADLAQAHAQLAQLQAVAAQPDPIVAHQSSEIAQLQAQLAQTEQAAAQQAREQAAQLRRQEQEIAQLRQEAAQLLNSGEIDRVEIARRLRSHGDSLRESALLLRMPESTLRSRLKEANGHEVTP